MRIDLHIHSTASDGSLSPGGVVSAARAGGLDVIAIADHDTAAGVQEARGTLPNQLHVIPAIELSTTYEGSELHLLGYFIDPTNAELVSYGLTAVQKRRERIKGILSRLEGIGIRMTFDEVVGTAEPGTRALGRPHVARTLVRRGFVQSVSEAFDRYIGDTGPAFLPTDLITPQAGIDLIHRTGGVAVWAHPRLAIFDRELDRLIGWGLDGVECYRPAVSPVDSKRLEQVARCRALLMTGGSDWHGAWQGRLGDFYVGSDEVEQFLERGGI